MVSEICDCGTRIRAAGRDQCSRCRRSTRKCACGRPAYSGHLECRRCRDVVFTAADLAQMPKGWYRVGRVLVGSTQPCFGQPCIRHDFCTRNQQEVA